MCVFNPFIYTNTLEYISGTLKTFLAEYTIQFCCLKDHGEIMGD